MRWLAEHREGDEVVYRIGRDGEELVAEWLGVVRLVAQRDGSEHRFVPDPAAPSRDVVKIVCGSGQLLLRHLQGELSLHGAAIECAGRAVILLADSGGGKSTLGASLCARPGVRFLADDAVALDDRGGPCVVPLERDHWLDADARAALGLGTNEPGKEPIAATVRATERSALAAFVELRFADVPSPVMTRLYGLEAVTALMPQIVRFVIDEPAQQQKDLDAVLDVLDRVPCFRLERPRALDLLSLATDLVLHVARDPEVFPTIVD